MKLARIEAHNLKGRTFSHDLAPLTLILGDNFKGKTAIIEAIRLALLGFIPEIGKQNKATWELSSHSALRVFIEFDGTDKSIERKWWLDGQKLSSSKNTTDNFDAAMEALPLLNSEHYFSLTDKQRVEYVFSRIKLPEGYTVDSIVARLQRLAFDEAHTEGIEKAKQIIIGTVRALLMPDSGLIGEGISLAKEACGRDFTYWNKREKETQGTVAILTELKNRAKEFTAEKVKALEEQIQEKQSRQQTLNQQIGGVREQVKTWENETTQRTRMAETLKKPVLDHSGAITKLESELAALLPLIVAMPEKGTMNALRDREHKLLADYNSLGSQRDEAKDQIDATELKLKELDSLETCPFCRSKGKNWKAEISKHYTSLIEGAKGRVTSLEALIDKTKKNVDAVQAEVEKTWKLFEDGENARTKSVSLQSRIDHLRFEEKTYKEQRGELETRFAGLSPLGEKPNTNPLEIELDLLIQQIDELSKKKTEATKLQQDLKRAAEAAIEHDTAAAHVKVIKAIGKELTGIQAEMVDAVFGGLLKTANSFVDGIFQSPLAFHAGEVGRWAEAKFIPHRVFSGTEKALAYIAIAAALSSQAPLRVLILDEIGRLDRGNQVKVLERLAAAVKNNIVDQVIVAGTESQAGEEWSVIRL